MKTEKTTHLKIKIKGKDIDNLKSAIKKVVDETKTIGFKSTSFTDDEKDVLIKLSDSLK